MEWLLIIFSFILIRVTVRMADRKICEINDRLASFKLNNWIVSQNDLNSLPPWKFEEWCSRFLGRIGYSDMQVFHDRGEGEKNIICKQDKSLVYVECFQAHPDSEKGSLDIDDFCGKIDRPAVQKLVGTMFHDNVNKGLILTTGCFSKEAVDYVKTLPDGYDIQLIDGDEISMTHWELIHNGVKLEVMNEEVL